MDLDDDSLDANPSSPAVENPMAYLGLRRRNETDSDATPVKKDPGIALNRRGIPARKRKKNSLIYGADDLVSIPVKSPKKRGPKTGFNMPTINIKVDQLHYKFIIQKNILVFWETKLNNVSSSQIYSFRILFFEFKKSQNKIHLIWRQEDCCKTNLISLDVITHNS